MALSDLQNQLLLVRQIGDVDETTGDPVVPTATGTTGVVVRSVGDLWEKYAAKEEIWPGLRDLYVLRDGQDIAIGILERLIDYTAFGQSSQIGVKLSQRTAARQKQRDKWQTEIERLEAKALQSSVAIGSIAIAEPIEPPLPTDFPSDPTRGPDANSPVYGGSPYWRRTGFSRQQ